MEGLEEIEPIMTSTDNPEPTGETGDNRKDLSGWKHVGEYASYLIYAKDNKRRLVDQKTGRTVIEYSI